MENTTIDKIETSHPLFSKTLYEKINFVKNFEDFEKSQNYSSFEKTSSRTDIFTKKEIKISPEKLQSTKRNKYKNRMPKKAINDSFEKQMNSEYQTLDKSDFLNYLKKFEDPIKQDCISFENFSNLLNEIEISQENFTKNDQSLIRNLWGVLIILEGSQEFISLTVLFQVLQILDQNKLQINRSAKLLQIIFENRLKDFNIFEDFNILREEKGLWSLEKIVIEFRKLINKDENENEVVCHSDKNINEIILNKEKDFENYNETLSKNQMPIAENFKKENMKCCNNRFEMLFEHSKYLKEKKEMSHALKYMQDLQQYSFKPKIIELNKKQIKFDSPIDKTKSKDPIKSIKIQNKDVWIDECFNRLYVNSKKKKERTEKYKQLNENSQLDTLDCTFKPIINKLYSSNNVNNNNIKGYDETIKRIVEARIEKEKTLKLYEEPLLRFAKNKKYIETRDTNFTVPQPFDFSSSKGNELLMSSKGNDLLMFVDVEVGNGKIGRIGIHHGDNMEKIAKNFAKIYTLNKDMEKKLVNNLKKQVENYYKSIALE